MAGGAPFAAQWPNRTYLELGALAGAVPSARLHARLVLGDWGLAGLSDSAELVVSELVANAGAPRGALSYPRCSREELEGGSWV